ncbi:Fimbrial assembly protein (PilN) [Natronincola peptidivorans]|uniref:Fimbrial assembly protein (PilN) n=1 Tax=Natronincola peptidivorans TaxID=426128 RepID=A0A1H9YQJ9_9FIRM|nr:PilN domain-containing protein [Natronincola peptidivorans]SES71337.1 Fimbrial assembly protein (PilN) [Natronincola peptidivorans]
MKDINFFEPYVSKQRGTEIKRFVLYLAILVTIIGVFSYPIFNFAKIKIIEKEITAMKANLETPEIVEQIQRVEEKEGAADSTRNELKIIENIDQEIANLDSINEVLLYGIFSTIPENLYFHSMNLSTNMIVINGRSNDKTAIAELEHNLRLTQIFEEIFIPSISLQEEIYSFIIELKVKDVN